MPIFWGPMCTPKLMPMPRCPPLAFRGSLPRPGARIRPCRLYWREGRTRWLGHGLRPGDRPRLRVLLIEAGPDYPDAAALPDDLQNGHHNSVRDHDWGFVYQPAPAIRPN